MNGYSIDSVPLTVGIIVVALVLFLGGLSFAFQGNVQF